MSAAKRKLKTLSLAEKLKVLEAAKCCRKKKDLAELFGLPMSTLFTILKNESEIMKKIANGQNLSGKRQCVLKFPVLEKCLLKWFEQCQDHNINVSGLLLKEKAELYSKLLGLVNFKASNGWLEKFKKRHELVFKKVCGESASAIIDARANIETCANIDTCDKWKSELQGLLHGYEPDDIFNADEMGLFFKCLPDKTLSFKNDKCYDGKHSKQRLTILLAANMLGTEKLTPLVIGKAKKPCCFSNCKSLPVKYETNTRAWMTSGIYQNWLMNIDEKMAKENRNILLFIDNCMAHKVIPQMKAVQIQYLPAFATLKLQPMEQGIIKNFKTLYRKEVVRYMLDNMEENKSSTIDVLQAIRMADKAWRNVTATTIRNSFVHCGFPFTSTEEAEVEDISIQPPAEWNTVVSETGICFDDFVTCDDGVMTAGSLSDNEIINSVVLKNETKDLDDIEDPNNTKGTPWVSIKEARTALNTLRNFIEQTSNSEEKEFSALHTLDNAIDRERPNYVKQEIYI